ncbi:hypothetical protein B296_00010380 [Ensete ventricosum]|uniref:ABC transmembrane type-1 domain-containing protein n=1 Tax=Ensete ventricosum TaxID=4639 RepID=A0A426ZN90_ENSVE|nr:hypothetical protein B296_00010380 [Ensete ventricosum]
MVTLAGKVRGPVLSPQFLLFSAPLSSFSWLDAWMAFCGDSASADRDGCSCGFGELFYSSSCLNHMVVSFVDAILIIAFLLNFVCRVSIRSVDARPLFGLSSSLRITTAVFNSLLGLVHLGHGFWMLVGSLRTDMGGVHPPHQWLLVLSQGFCSVLVVLIVSVRRTRFGHTFIRIWSLAASFSAGFVCLSSVLAVLAEKKASFLICVDILSLPGAVLLLLSTFKESNQADDYEAADGSLYEPLKDESSANEENSDESVTPFAKAGFFSRMSFWWLNPLMKKGYQGPLEEKDIPQLGKVDRAETCYLRFLEQLDRQKERQQTSSPSILWAIVSCFQKEIVVSGFFALLKILTLSAGPLLLNAFIKVSLGNEAFEHEGYVLAFGMFLAKCLESVSQRQWYFRTRRLGLQVRSLLSAAIYQKQLKLSNSAKLDHSSGEIMNYVTVDAYRIGEFPFWFHQTWTTSLQLCIALAILYHAVGLATISAMVVIVVTVLCNAPLAKLQHKFQTRLMEAQDVRLKAVSEALVNMKVLKLYAWETHFRKVIEGLRETECKWLSAFQLRRAYNSFLFWSSPVLVSAAAFSTCYLLHIPLNPSNVFTFVATLRLVQDPVRQIPDVIGVVIQAKVAFARILKFLDAPELQSNSRVGNMSQANVRHPVVIEAGSFSWEENTLKPTLRGINLVVKAKEKVAICGEVGSGKSTLLAAILREIPKTEGMVRSRSSHSIFVDTESYYCIIARLSQS